MGHTSGQLHRKDGNPAIEVALNRLGAQPALAGGLAIIGGCLAGEALAARLWSINLAALPTAALTVARLSGICLLLLALLLVRAHRTAARRAHGGTPYQPPAATGSPDMRRSRAVTGLLMLGAAAAGLALSAGEAALVARSPYRAVALSPVEQELTLTGLTTGVARPRAGGGSYIPVLATSIDGQACVGRLELVWPDGPVPLPGETICWRGTLYLPERQLNPYEFDARRALARRGLAARSRWIGPAHGGGGEPWGPAALALRILFAPLRVAGWARARLGAAFAGHLPEDTRAMACAFVLGDRSGLAGPPRDAFEATGSLHLAAVSGLHVGLLAAAASRLFARFLGAARARVPTSAVVSLFALLTGMAAPVMRAALMLLIAAWRPRGSRAAAPNSLGAAALVICALNPLAAGDPSFELSFAAALAITCCQGRLRCESAGRGRLGRLGRSISAALTTSTAASALTLPIIVHNYHRLCPWSAVNNLVLLPLGSLVITVCLAVAMLTVIVPAVLGLLAPLLILLTRLLGAAASALARLPLSLVAPGHPGNGTLLLATAIGIWAALSWPMPGERSPAHSPARHRLGGPHLWMAAACAAVFLIAALVHRPPGDLTVWFFAVGQGDLAVLRSGRAAVIVDFGPPGPPDTTGQSAFARRVLPYLLATRVRPALAVATHPHADHVGGLADALSWWPDLPVYTRAELAAETEEWFPQPSRGARVIGVADPIQVIVGGSPSGAGPPSQLDQAGSDLLVLDLFWAGQAGVDHVNELSVAVRAAKPGEPWSVLLTGDGGHPAEQAWLRQRPAGLGSTVLKVGHHGAAGASGDTFLAAVSPLIAVISVGPNRFGHPAPAALSRLNRAVPVLLRTDTHGWIEVVMRRRGPEVRHWSPAGLQG